MQSHVRAVAASAIEGLSVCRERRKEAARALANVGAVAAVGVGVYVWCRFRPVSTRKELLLDSSIMTFPMMQVDSLTAV